MATTLTKQEFAAALGMKSNEVFVKKMFLIVDKDKTGRISFQNFLDTVVRFTSGSSEDKLGIIFDMCDNDQNGIIQTEELKDMLRSLIAIAKTDNIHQDDVATLLSSMFR